MGIDTIQNNPETDLYKRFSFLAEYENYLSKYRKLSLNEIVGEGNYGVVINGPSERVYKIGKNKKCSDKLLSEYDNHVSFYLLFDTISNKFPNFRIPETVMSPQKITGALNKEILFIYEMEKIEGFSLNYHHIRTRYSEDLPLSERKEILKNESIFENYLIDNEIIMNPGHVHWQDDLGKVDCRYYFPVGFFEGYSDDDVNQFSRTVKLTELYFPELKQQFIDLLVALYEKGFRHLDLHAKNIMISYSKDEYGNPKTIIYLIDYGIVETPLKY